MPKGVRKWTEKKNKVEAGAADDGGSDLEAPPTYKGTIRFVDDERGYGFITCPEVSELYGDDIRLHHRQFEGFGVGDIVRFRIQVNSRGQPQAVDLRACGLLEETATATFEEYNASRRDYTEDARLSGDAVHRRPSLHHGRVKLIDEIKGFGFIRSEEYALDVFLSQHQINGLSVGDYVRFSVKINKRGQPQASNLSSCRPPSPTQDSLNSPPGKNTGPYDCAPQPRRNGLSHQGTVKKIDNERGFGFVACQALFDLYGSDVFASEKNISGFAVGDHVSFVVKLNKKGQPQATELSACGPSVESGHDADWGEDEDLAVTRMTGTIKSFDADRGYGFISSPDATAEYGRDVFLHSKQIKRFRPSDHVAFSVRINAQGLPQAYSLSEAPRSVAWLAAGDEEAPSAGGEEYAGEIKSFSSSHGYGFIECSSLHEMYGRDVFVHQSEVDGLQVGDRVRFRVQVRRGQPQACGVERAEERGGQDAAAAACESAREVAESSCPAPDRRLLRACASTCRESIRVMESLLAASADANGRDVTGQTPLMVAALNAYHGERKCRLLIQNRADLDAMYNDATTVLQWARERLNPKFAAFLEGLQQGKNVEYTVALDIPRDTD